MFNKKIPKGTIFLVVWLLVLFTGMPTGFTGGRYGNGKKGGGNTATVTMIPQQTQESAPEPNSGHESTNPEGYTQPTGGDTDGETGGPPNEETGGQKQNGTDGTQKQSKDEKLEEIKRNYINGLSDIPEHLRHPDGARVSVKVQEYRQECKELGEYIITDEKEKVTLNDGKTVAYIEQCISVEEYKNNLTTARDNYMKEKKINDEDYLYATTFCIDQYAHLNTEAAFDQSSENPCQKFFHDAIHNNLNLNAVEGTKVGVAELMNRLHNHNILTTYDNDGNRCNDEDCIQKYEKFVDKNLSLGSKSQNYKDEAIITVGKNPWLIPAGGAALLLTGSVTNEGVKYLFRNPEKLAIPYHYAEGIYGFVTGDYYKPRYASPQYLKTYNNAFEWFKKIAPNISTDEVADILHYTAHPQNAMGGEVLSAKDFIEYRYKHDYQGIKGILENLSKTDTDKAKILGAWLEMKDHSQAIKTANQTIRQSGGLLPLIRKAVNLKSALKTLALVGAEELLRYSTADASPLGAVPTAPSIGQTFLSGIGETLDVYGLTEFASGVTKAVASRFLPAAAAGAAAATAGFAAFAIDLAITKKNEYDAATLSPEAYHEWEYSNVKEQAELEGYDTDDNATIRDYFCDSDASTQQTPPTQQEPSFLCEIKETPTGKEYLDSNKIEDLID